MRTLFFGTDDGRPPGFAYQCVEAFRSLGHEAKALNFRKYKLHKTAFTNRLLNRWLFNAAEKYNPDLLLINKGSNILPGFVERMSKKGIKTVNWTLDEPFGKVNRYNLIPNIKEYEYFFVFDPYYVEELRTMNSNSYYLPCAADPLDVHREMIPLAERKYEHDLSFIGSHDGKRETILKEFSSYDIKIAGYRWNKTGDTLKDKIDSKVYVGHEMCSEFNKCRININIHAPHSIQGVNIRTFEIPACNSFQLCDYFKEIPNLFANGKEIVCYNDTKELKELADYYMDKGNEEERNRITKAGHERVLKEHTVKHRIQKILEYVKK